MLALFIGIWSSQSRFLNQQHLAAAFATPRYSTLAKEHDTTTNRLEDHEISASPKKMQNPEVDRRVAGQPAQSA
jgi:hypothetical protein